MCVQKIDATHHFSLIPLKLKGYGNLFKQPYDRTLQLPIVYPLTLYAGSPRNHN